LAMKIGPFCAEVVGERAAPKLSGSPKPVALAAAMLSSRAAVRVVKALTVLLAVAVVTSVGLFARFVEIGAATTRGPALKLYLHRGPQAVRIANQTDATWDACSVTVLGNYQHRFGTLKPGASVEVGYGEFKAGATAPAAHADFSRLLWFITVSCQDDVGGIQSVMF
jgi:hypothetical protein